VNQADRHHDTLRYGSALKSWLAVLSVALGAFVFVTSEFLPIGLLTQISAGLHISDGTAGLMVTIPGLVATFAAPLMTIGAGKVDRRILVLGLTGLLVASNMTSAFASSFAVMLAGRVMFGISVGGFWTIAVTLGSRLVPKPMMTRATTIIAAGISTATVLGVPAGTLIAGFAGWRMAFAAIGGVALLCGLAQLFVLPRLPPPPASGVRQLTHLLRHADARLGLLTIAFVIAGHFAAYTYVTPFLRENASITPGYLSTVLLAYGAAGIVGNFAGGAGVAHNLRATMTGVVALMAGAILLLPLIRGHQPGVTILLVAWGLAFGAMPVSFQLWVFKAAPEALEGGAALLVCTFQIFIALGSVLGGRVVDAFGTSAVMWTGGGAAVVGLTLVRLSRHSPKQIIFPSPQGPEMDGPCLNETCCHGGQRLGDG
jgi:predicted MFS family arabinose efflux permease